MCHFKSENSNTYFIHKITINEKTVKRNKKIKHSIISKLYNLTTLNVLGPKYAMKREGNVTYLSVLDRHCIQWVCMSSNCHKLLVLTAATGLWHMMVRIKKQTYAHQDHTQRNTKSAKHAHCKILYSGEYYFHWGFHILYSCKVCN